MIYRTEVAAYTLLVGASLGVLGFVGYKVFRMESSRAQLAANAIYTYQVFGNPVPLDVQTIDGCQYLINPSMRTFTHKGNCNNHGK